MSKVWRSLEFKWFDCCPWQCTDIAVRLSHFWNWTGNRMNNQCALENGECKTYSLDSNHLLRHWFSSRTEIAFGLDWGMLSFELGIYRGLWTEEMDVVDLLLSWRLCWEIRWSSTRRRRRRRRRLTWEWGGAKVRKVLSEPDGTWTCFAWPPESLHFSGWPALRTPSWWCWWCWCWWCWSWWCCSWCWWSWWCIWKSWRWCW